MKYKMYIIGLIVMFYFFDEITDSLALWCLSLGFCITVLIDVFSEKD
jgi:hypothetical protein